MRSIQAVMQCTQVSERTDRFRLPAKGTLAATLSDRMAHGQRETTGWSVGKQPVRLLPDESVVKD